MTLPPARQWLRPMALLCLAGVGMDAAQAQPQRDPLTVRGCLDKHWLRITESDATDLSGIKQVRLKGSKAMLRMLDDGHGRYVGDQCPAH
jgi:hypothetical protein